VKNIYYFILSISMIGCAYQDSLEIQLKAPKIILNAILIANESPSVYIGRAFAPTGKIPSDHFIENANVVLYEDDKIIGRLSYQKNGIYTLPTYQLKPDKRYKFVVKATGYPDAQNTAVLMPKNVEVSSVIFDSKTDYPTLNTFAKGRLLSVILLDSLKGEFYGIGIKKTKLGYNVSGNIYPIEVGTTGLSTLNTDCYKFLPVTENVEYSLTRELFEAYILYNASCFGKQKKMGLVVDTYGTVQTPDKDGKYYSSQIDRLQATVVTFSEEYFIYAKNIKVLEGIDNAFFEPQRTYTNVLNGYGVVVAMNKKTVIFNL
jgi:hypothetical protein